MSVTRLGRRSFGFVALALAGVAVYFQAAGAAEWVVARALLGAAVATPASVLERGSPRPPAATSRRATSGDAILALNPFDSVTGPLDRAAFELAIPQAREPSPDLGDPLNAPACPGVTVRIVTESSDPEWSVAQLQGPGDAQASARRVGDAVGPLEVAFIGFNAAKLSPAVWLSGEKRFCNVLLFGGKEELAAAPSRPAAAAQDEGRRDRGSRASSGAVLPAEVADKIQRISDTEFVIDRSVIDFVLENQTQLIGSPRIVAEQKDGKTVGVRVFGVRPNSLLGTLGLQNGDRLETINGHDITTPVKALEAYAQLPTASSLSIQLTRRGKPTTLEIQIR
jgi:general secretion pathway protein C